MAKNLENTVESPAESQVVLIQLQLNNSFVARTLQSEVLYYALMAMKNNPSITPNTAVMFGLSEFDK